MSMVVGLVSLLLVLFLMGRRLPVGRWPVIIAVTLAAILIIVLIERAGLWPQGWKVR